ncbi:hypothetical protein [uncultured Paraglaciecola sp.]|uniref:hypothetical protein n=1 Tax=uncultured Paraglaciecola sp. TaxID=1765024 RepID=UPI002623ACB8|nr:hypothetical protein [uncultured Paraglaciecola sp.]
MNPHNQALKTRIDKVTKAINQLMSYGCAIKSLCVNDQGNVIEILPPLNAEMSKKLQGIETTITGNQHGRHFHSQTRLHGCTVLWQSHPQLQTK